MNEENFVLSHSSGLVSHSYIEQAQQARKQRENLIKILLSQRKLPDEGWDDLTIEFFLKELSLMDSNNFVSNIGVGEREGRVYNKLVSQSHFNFSHGIGRSGDISEEQPKAAGSSLIARLTNYLVLHAFKLAGVSSCLVLPTATGLSISLTLLALRQDNPNGEICNLDKGLTPLIIPNVLEGDEVRTNLSAIEDSMVQYGKEVLCVLSTTSCFAPRAPDKIIEISILCDKYQIGHVVNNAFGLQSSKICHLISESCRVGRVDAFIQSTDKNFLVPVGGAIIASSSSKTIQQISKTYPGRASSAPIVDLFITLLSLGVDGYKKVLQERKELFIYFKDSLINFAGKHKEKVLQTSNNAISMCMSLTQFSEGSTFIGSMLFSRFVSGTRTVDPKAASKSIGNFSFASYGSHIDNYPCAYLTASCAVGIKKSEIDTFFQRLEKAFVGFAKQKQKQSKEILNKDKEEIPRQEEQLQTNVQKNQEQLELKEEE